MDSSRTSAASRRRSAAATWLGLTFGTMGAAWTVPQPARVPPASPAPISVTVTRVPLSPRDPSVVALGDFRYAGGVGVSSGQTNLLHELSDIVVTGQDRFAAVGDEGVLFEGRFLFDEAGRLAGVADATLGRLTGADGRPLTSTSADAEGLAVLPDGDRLVSFERRARIWLYPSAGGPPRPVPSPPGPFQPNLGMEALTSDPSAGADGYLVGAEDSGATWTCRVSTTCVPGPTVEKPAEFGLVSMIRLPQGATAYLLRAYDPVRLNRVILKIVQGRTVIARMDLAPPLTVDNFEGLGSTAVDGGQRFYLLSDDNNRPSQRTLILAFDWHPR